MLTYFIRRYLITLGLAPLIAPLLAYGFAMDQFEIARNRDGINDCFEPCQSMIQTLHLDKPWPLNYIGYMFPIYGGSALTGDFGVSVNVSRGTPVAEMFRRY